ncbi:MAG: ankyrin repeat domain-containing protein [Acidobacteria bacterium]|nr:ankyrin repeat domain-containing protein [Acidobacteriota bacterium]
MIRPYELDTDQGRATWDTFVASATGDVAALRELLAGNPRLGRAEYWYTPVIHFAVREGHADAVRVLLDAGADPESNGLHDGSLIEMAAERGHAAIVRLLEQARDRRGRIVPGSDDHPIHLAVTRADADDVRRLLDGDPSLVHLGNAKGASPLHRAVGRGDYEIARVLLDRGANVHATVSAARGLKSIGGGFWTDLQAIDIAIWHGRERPVERRIIDLLFERGATCDVAVASALGDLDSVRRMLDADARRIHETRPSGRRPLSAAVEAGHDVVHLLLARGADPTWEEPTAPKGRALHAAASAGNVAMAELLLAHGADPNGMVDSSGSATFAASGTPALLDLLVAHGGVLDPFLIWIDHDDEAIRQAIADPGAACRSDALTTVCTLGKRELLVRLLDAGVTIPAVLTGCQTYLLEHADMLRTLLARGMNPNLMNWQHQTLLHFICVRQDAAGAIERAAILLDAGADISAREDEYRSTPLAWAARVNAGPIVEFLLQRGAPTSLPDDDAWATPLAWAQRRGHAEVASMLRSYGAGPLR